MYTSPSPISNFHGNHHCFLFVWGSLLCVAVSAAVVASITLGADYLPPSWALHFIVRVTFAAMKRVCGQPEEREDKISSQEHKERNKRKQRTQRTNEYSYYVLYEENFLPGKVMNGLVFLSSLKRFFLRCRTHWHPLFSSSFQRRERRHTHDQHNSKHKQKTLLWYTIGDKLFALS